MIFIFHPLNEFFAIIIQLSAISNYDLTPVKLFTGIIMDTSVPVNKNFYNDIICQPAFVIFVFQGTGAAIIFEYIPQCLWRVFENIEKTPVKATKISEIINTYSTIV